MILISLFWLFVIFIESFCKLSIRHAIIYEVFFCQRSIMRLFDPIIPYVYKRSQCSGRLLPYNLPTTTVCGVIGEIRDGKKSTNAPYL